jgi:hypothetical protein
VADLVPVRRGSAEPVRRAVPRPESQPKHEVYSPKREVYAPLFSPFAEFDELWNLSGSFEYRTTIPSGVDASQVEAQLDNGLLTVRVPRPERSKTHRIKIN